MEQVPPLEVPAVEMQGWKEAAISARFVRQGLNQISDPAEGSPFIEDNARYRWEKASDWTRAYLTAGLEHLELWANIIQPLNFDPSIPVVNPPRTYHTIGRAALESAGTAAWIMLPDSSEERTLRHLRVHFQDLRYFAEALAAVDASRAAAVRDQMATLLDRTDGTWSRTSVRAEPRYSIMLREACPPIGISAEEISLVYRAASAAAHGKVWYRQYGGTQILGEEYEPGHFRSVTVPDPSQITRTMRSASTLVTATCLRFGILSGAPMFTILAEAKRRTAVLMRDIMAVPPASA